MDRTEASDNVSQISPEVKDTFERAKAAAEKRGTSHIDLVYALNALLDDKSIIQALNDKGIDHHALRFFLENHLDSRSVEPVEGNSESKQIVSEILWQAISHAFANKSHADVTNIDLLNAIWNTSPSPAREFYAVTAIDMCLAQDIEAVRSCSRANFVFQNFASGSITRPEDANYRVNDELESAATDKITPAAEKSVVTFKDIEFCTNLTYKAFMKTIDPVFGRDTEIDNMIQVISLRKKNNPILLGEPGVGKTAVVEGLAVRIVENDVPMQLKGTEIVALDVASFIAGSRQRGDFEQRISNLVKTLEANPNVILFVDEIHTLVGGTLGASDAAELLKPALSSGKIKVIGATTHGEYLKYFGKNPAMARRFQPIAIVEPTADEAIQIIEKIVPTYAAHHDLKYCATASRLAVELSKAFIVDKQLPDKAIDVIDRAGALAKSTGKQLVEEADFYDVVQRMSGIKISANENFASTVLADLKKRILGQDEACTKIAKALARANSGYTRDDRAKCSILLYGPSSTGKRHAARQIASVLNTKMIRLDMTEFTEPHSISRLVGSPPGYVGYGEGGQLSEAARRNPSSVIFLDSIDHAHSNVVSIIMQAIENGAITDSMGNVISFTGATIVMSIAHEIKKTSIGFGSPQAEDTNDNPEGISRQILDAVDVAVEFKPMPADALTTVASGYVKDFVSRLAKKDVAIFVPESIDEVLAELAKKDGGSAKAVERAFKKLLEDPVLDALPQRGHHVRVNVENNKSTVDFIAP